MESHELHTIIKVLKGLKIQTLYVHLLKYNFEVLVLEYFHFLPVFYSTIFTNSFSYFLNEDFYINTQLVYKKYDAVTD